MYQRDIKNNFREYLSWEWELFSNIIGIISLSGNEYCPLMWPHYTLETGFQIKFKTDTLLSGIKNNLKGKEYLFSLKPINYTEKLKPIDFLKFHRRMIPFHYMMNIKKENWKYENEWRIIVSKPNMGIPYSKAGLLIQSDRTNDEKKRRTEYNFNSIIEIVLGNNFFTTANYKIQHNIDKSTFTIEPKVNKINKNGCTRLEFLNFLFLKFKDRIYYSGERYDDSGGELEIKRSKERLEIKKLSRTKFEFKKTNEIS